MQRDVAPDQWRRLDRCACGRADGGRDLPQVAARRFGMLAGHQSRVNPFAERPTYVARRAALRERGRAPRDPDVRRRDPRGGARSPGRRGHVERVARAVRAPVPARRSARLRAAADSAAWPRIAARERARARGGPLRPHARRRRPRAAVLPGAELRRRQRRTDPRDDPPSAIGARPRRRRRALRHRVRREHDHVHAVALGARPARGRASRSRRPCAAHVRPAALYGLDDRGVLAPGYRPT